MTPTSAGSLYYFNIRSDRTLKQDPEGSTLPDLKAALQEALALARLSLKIGDRKGQDRRGWRVEIMDRANEHLMSVAFTEADLCEWPRRGKSPAVPHRALESEVAMEPRVSVITLGVSDLAESQAFYERLGWRCSKRMTEEVVLFQLGGLVLSLLPREVLAREADLPPEGSGFSGVALAYNTRSKARSMLSWRQRKTLERASAGRLICPRGVAIQATSQTPTIMSGKSRGTLGSSLLMTAVSHSGTELRMGQ
jgi:hypothetical protein